jgi:hypothetical protein
VNCVKIVNVIKLKFKIVLFNVEIWIFVIKNISLILWTHDYTPIIVSFQILYNFIDILEKCSLAMYEMGINLNFSCYSPYIVVLTIQMNKIIFSNFHSRVIFLFICILYIDVYLLYM